MSEVSILGLGAMGSALGRALLSHGHLVTVWNRTSAKAEPLVRAGALQAVDVAAAVAASPATIVCLDGYDAADQILSEPRVVSQLAGRVLVQLSTGTPEDARAGERRAHDMGAVYLDGAILAYPDQMGTADAALLVAGPEATFQACERWLRSLAGGLTYVGRPIGAASAADCASLSFAFGAYLGALHGARICEVEGLNVEEFGATLAGLLPVVGGEVTQLTARIQASRFDDSHAALGTYAAVAQRLVQQARDGGIPPGFPAYVSNALQEGLAAGLGSEDLAALVKVLRVSPVTT